MDYISTTVLTVFFFHYYTSYTLLYTFFHCHFITIPSISGHHYMPLFLVVPCNYQTCSGRTSSNLVLCPSWYCLPFIPNPIWTFAPACHALYCPHAMPPTDTLHHTFHPCLTTSLLYANTPAPLLPAPTTPAPICTPPPQLPAVGLPAALPYQWPPRWLEGGRNSTLVPPPPPFLYYRTFIHGRDLLWAFNIYAFLPTAVTTAITYDFIYMPYLPVPVLMCACHSVCRTHGITFRTVGLCPYLPRTLNNLCLP